MISEEELRSLRDYLEQRSKEPWSCSPSDSSLRACRTEAKNLLGSKETVQTEIAALFYTMSIDEGRMGDARFQMPVKVASAQIRQAGFVWRMDWRQRLHDLQDEIAGGMQYEDVRDWFEQNLKK